MFDWTFTLAAIGCILGIFNFYRSFKQDQVRIKVIPEYVSTEMMGKGGGVDSQELFHVTVVNLSNFPVTITEVGLIVNEARCKATCLAKVGKGTIPFRLESRNSIQLQIWDVDFSGGLDRKDTQAVYAQTACGVEEEGVSNAIDRFKLGTIVPRTMPSSMRIRRRVPWVWRWL